MSKELNLNLQKAIRVIKHLDGKLQDLTQEELSEISRTNTKYLQRNKDSIEAYFESDTPKASNSDIRYVLNHCLEYYIKIATKKNEKFIFRNILGSIVGYLLKWEYKLLGHIQKNTKIIEIGIAVIELICLVNSRKDKTKGTPISANSKSARKLLNSNKVAFIDKLFIRTDSYKVGNRAKSWKLTKLSTDLLGRSIDIFFDRSDYILCPLNSETYSSICSPVDKTLHVCNLDVNIVKTLSLSSILHILSMSLSYVTDTNELIVSLEHTSTTDESLGRNYNLFCRLRSQERLALGYIAYDISSALQTISLQLVKGTKDDYPILTSYSTNKALKQSVRRSIADDLGINISDVKAKLTAFANGGISGKDKHPLYKKFQEESDRLRREVISHTATNNPCLLEQAIDQSKRILPEDIDWFSLKPEDSQTMARNKSSVFFYIWTYYERIIRKVMLKLLPDGIEVHDAVYSKMNINVETIEEEVFKSTSFKVIIDKG